LDRICQASPVLSSLFFDHYAVADLQVSIVRAYAKSSVCLEMEHAEDSRMWILSDCLPTDASREGVPASSRSPNGSFRLLNGSLEVSNGSVSVSGSKTLVGAVTSMYPPCVLPRLVIVPRGPA
jgi:hypothetical protein